ncbi:MAG: branched-chain amino acid ABC transporter permease [Rhodospirillales bacterium]|nr:branched-chain amino acid ABC transporter permease [Rhodospirillales bacterium]
MLFSPAAIAFIAVAIVVLPVIQRPVVAAEILVLGIAAVAMNLLIGYTGMLSFGQAMFFGISAYITGILVTKAGVSAFVAIPVAVAATGVVAALVGAFCVRRSGLYFICITFAFNQMFYFIAYSWTSVTGGEDGLPGIARPAIIADPISFYVFTAAVFVAALAVLKMIVDSPTGRILQAIRDNPNRAAATGHDVGRYKLVAFTISGTFIGLAGAVFAFIYEIMPVDKIHWLFSGDLVFMTLIGGTGSFIGPVIGAAFYTFLQETVSLFWDRWPMALGTVFALVVLFFRTGVIGVVEAGYERFRRQREKPANP